MPKKVDEQFFLLWSDFYGRYLRDSKGDLYVFQKIDRARKAAGSLQSTVYRDRNIRIKMVVGKFKETDVLSYERSIRSKVRDKARKSR
jgi:hypothetical protein